MKFGQLMQFNTKGIFLKKYSKNMIEKLVQDPFLKNQN